jgi:hypothetical protein
VAACVRRLGGTRQLGGNGLGPSACRHQSGGDVSKKSAGWPRHPGALAGRPRRAQSSLRALGIEISFTRRGAREHGRSGGISSGSRTEPQASVPPAASARYATTSRYAVETRYKSWPLDKPISNADDADGKSRKALCRLRRDDGGGYFESAFLIDENGGGPGVRLREPERHTQREWVG